MAQLVKRRVVNPAPAVLAIVNTTRRRKMATKKRKSSKRRVSAKRRSNPVNPVNPTRRRSTKTRSSKHRSVYARARNPVNPVGRRKRYGRRRQRNPVSGLFGRAVPLVLGSAAIGMAAPLTAQLVSRFAPQLLGSPIGAAGVTFGTGWGLSALAGMFSFTRRYKDDILLAGAVLAGGQLFSAYVAPMIPRIGGAAGQGMGRRGMNGMNGIAAVHGIPPQIAPPPVPPQNGMQGIAARPGNWAR